MKKEDFWQTTFPIGLIENIDLLFYASTYCEKIDFKGSILYCGGWVSKKTIGWLKAQTGVPIIIFPDYDLVGLKNYIVLKQEIPSLQIYVPDQLDELLRRFGKAEKLDSTIDRSMIEDSNDPDVQK